MTREHERYYAPARAGLPARNVVEQPVGRGTAPSIFYALLRLRTVAPGGTVAILPSDHYVDDDAAFMARVEGAMEAVTARPDTIVLLGMQPDRPESQYGWIEPDDVVLGPWSWPIYRVRRFWEKPSEETARRLMRAGALWNSFVIVGNPAVIEHLVCRALPALAEVFARSVPSAVPPGKARPPASRTRDSSPVIFRAMSWSGIPSGSRCSRSRAPPGRIWATLRGRSPHARSSSVRSDGGARWPQPPRIGLGPRRRPRKLPREPWRALVQSCPVEALR